MPLPPVEIELQERSYSAWFEGDWESLDRKFPAHRRLLLTESNVAKFHLDYWQKLIPRTEIIIVPAGENSKTLRSAEEIFTLLIRKNFSRDTLIYNLGGGMIGDLGGFIAATFMRGVKYIQIPTSLLAMVDAAVGGKVGVNHHLGKNLIGCFYQPLAVFVRFQHLETLPRREWLCGLGEAFKYGLIADESLFEKIGASMNSPAPKDWLDLETIRRCVEIKASVVSRDETETSGLRMILNFGHTIGHALEAASGYETYKHGEAVVAGMAGAVFLSHLKGLLRDDDYQPIIESLSQFPLPRMSEGLSSEVLNRFIIHDKKVSEGRSRFVLLQGVGKPVIVEDIEKPEIERALAFTLDFINRNG